ncbi:MAG: Rieske 2Fe-2S domain-containing protein, partial [Actinomycetota bacterium]
MSTATVLAIVIPVLVVLAGILLLGAARRRETDAATGTLSRETRKRDRGATLDDEGEVTGKEVEQAAVVARSASLEPATAPPPAPYVPPDEEQLGVNRRQFLNRGIIGFMGLGIAGFGAATLAFIWPQAGGGFGSKIRVGSVSDVKAKIDEGGGFFYFAAGKMWITEYPADALEKARSVYSPSELAGMEAGLVALFQTCPHLGCRVPECATSQWFECPCHGSRYNRVGERRGGPAPRGMDRFAMSVEGGAFTVDTGNIIDGPPIGVNTTNQQPEGPSCLGGS